MDNQGIQHLVLEPAPGVTDLEEWYGRLDDALGMRHDARWHCEQGEALAADLPHEEAIRALKIAREVLGDALVVASGPEPPEVIVTEAAPGIPWLSEE